MPSALPSPPPDPVAHRARAAAEVEAITLKLRAERRERIIAQRALKQSADSDLQGSGALDKMEEERSEREKKAAMDALVEQVHWH